MRYLREKGGFVAVAQVLGKKKKRKTPPWSAGILLCLFAIRRRGDNLDKCNEQIKVISAVMCSR